MKVFLVEVDWAMLFWFSLLFLNIIACVIQTIAESKVRKELIRQNQLIIEQNDKINTVIIRVCSKSVRYRKAAEKEENKEESKE
jgi:hypothetical protein